MRIRRSIFKGVCDARARWLECHAKGPSYLRTSAEARAQAYVEAFKLFEKPLEASDIDAIVKEISEGLEHARRSAAELRKFKMSQDFQVELGTIPAVIRRDLNLERQKLDAQRKNTSIPFRPDVASSGTQAGEAAQLGLELKNSIAAVLDGHRQGFADIDQTVVLLERLESNLRSEGQRRDFFLNLLWTFQAEPFHPSDQRPYFNVHAVVIRVWAKHGNTDELAEHAFSPLTYEKPEVVEGWLRLVSPEIIYSLGNYPKRFAKSAREAFASYSKLYANRDFGSLEAGVQEKLQQSIQRIQSQIKRIEFLEVQEQLADGEVEVSVNMPKKKNDADKQEPTKLTVPHADAESKIPGQTKRKLQVFLCHSATDKVPVRSLFSKLKGEGFDPWLDEEKLLPGQDWELEISNAVRSTDVVVVCLSNTAVAKAGYVHKEIKYALDIAERQPEGTIFIIPVKLEVCDVPDRLSKWHWVELLAHSGYEKLTKALNQHAAAIGLITDPQAVPHDENPTLQHRQAQWRDLATTIQDAAQRCTT